jgi:flagellar FliL protein
MGLESFPALRSSQPSPNGIRTCIAASSGRLKDDQKITAFAGTEDPMASAEQTDSEPDKKSGSMGKIMIWLVIVAFSIGGGFATPLLIAQLSQPVDESQATQLAQPDPNEEVEFIDFDEVVAVLGNSRFSRYLKMNFSLQVAKSQKLKVEELIEKRKALLTNRIIAHVAEIDTEDLEGKFGHNQLRRKMHSFFNEILFDDGIERVQDVLFRELQVQ